MTAFSETLIIIPAYNEAASLAHVIDNVRAAVPWADIVVVNDGSRDATADIARSSGVFILNLPYNLGIGGAVQTGYKFAARMGYEVAVQVDGDGQHPAGAIERLVEVLTTTNANMVIGSRYIPGGSYNTPFTRLVGIRILSAIISLLAGQRVTDTTSGFRAVDRRVLCFLAHMYPRDYPEPESVALLCREGFRIAEEPVAMRERMEGESSISLLGGLYYVMKVLLATFIDVFEKRVGEGGTR